MKKILIILTLVIILAVGGALVFKGKKQTETMVTIAIVIEGDITSGVTATGKIFPETEVRISSGVPGEIIQLSVQEGKSVARGALLVRVNTDTLDAQAAQQEAALRASEANSQQARAQMLQSELNLKRIKNLFAKGFATQDSVDEASTTYEIGKASFDATLSRIEQQEMQLKEARDSLAKATTYAPIDGTITVLNSELGDRVVGTGQFEGTEIMRIADLDKMEVQVDVSEADIVEVKIGDAADIEIDAFPDRVFVGEVTEIANSADTSNQRSQDQLTTFKVKVKLLETSVQIRPGMTATADIKTKTHSNVIKVPLQAVTVRAKSDVRKQLDEESPKDDVADDEQKENGDKNDKDRRRRDNLQRLVFRVEEGKAILARVETGIADNRWIEITSGISVGDEVVTGSYRVLARELKHDQAVAVEDKKSREGGSRDKKSGKDS